MRFNICRHPGIFDWSETSEFSCELPEGHEGPHRLTVEWEDPFAVPVQETDGDMLRAWPDRRPE